jgi:hypothetical protein
LEGHPSPTHPRKKIIPTQKRIHRHGILNFNKKSRIQSVFQCFTQNVFCLEERVKLVEYQLFSWDRTKLRIKRDIDSVNLENCVDPETMKLSFIGFAIAEIELTDPDIFPRQITLSNKNGATGYKFNVKQPEQGWGHGNQNVYLEIVYTQNLERIDIKNLNQLKIIISENREKGSFVIKDLKIYESNQNHQ